MKLHTVREYVVLSLLILAAMSSCKSTSLSNNSCLFKDSTSRRIEEGESQLINLWNKEINIEHSPGVLSFSYIDAKDGILAISDAGCTQLRLVTLNTGTTISKFDLPSHQVMFDRLVSDRLYITIMYGTTGRFRRVAAIDTNLKQKIWENSELDGKRVGITLQPEDNQNLVLYVGTPTDDNYVRLLDTGDGKIRIIPITNDALVYHNRTFASKRFKGRNTGLA